ncbi:hypothetical protein MC885_009988 [Smutsia gigantea]|nr:hypothetical protein MC885_009988 [Smutsia gigantea]
MGRSGMAGAVKDYIKMMLQNDSLKFLVFAHHLSMLQACTEAVIENKTRYIRIDGSVPSAERIHLVNQFQKDPDTRVAILSIQAAGQGLTFTAATHVVFAELYWDPGHIKQAEDRAHRIGQSSSVNIHYLIANGTLDTLMWGMLNRKAQITGSTLNGRKEQLKAEESDKEKWDFLQFAEAWSPNESSEELRNEILFTHIASFFNQKCPKYLLESPRGANGQNMSVSRNIKDIVFCFKLTCFEKEKQHDIRSFFLPKPKKRQLVTSRDESRIFQEKNTVAPVDPERVATRDIVDYESSFEPEAKRLKSVTTSDHCSSLEEKPFWPGTTQALAQSAASPLTGKGWQCGFCTYINDSVLPYCEMCENPQGSAGNLNCTKKKNKNEKECFQKETSKKLCTSSDSIKQILAQSEPEQLAENMEEISKIKREHRLTPEPGDEQLKNSDGLLVYDTLMFRASKNTDRIHLYTKCLQIKWINSAFLIYNQDGNKMNCNFIPLDIKLDLWEDLPASFQLKQNRSLLQSDSQLLHCQSVTTASAAVPKASFAMAAAVVYASSSQADFGLDEHILRFVREWSGLTAMKQKVVRRSGQLFHSPLLALEENTKQQCKQSSTKRYITKEDVSGASMDKLKNDGGHVRLITKEPRPRDLSTKKFLEDGACVPSLNPCIAQADLRVKPSTSKGYLQAVDNEGNALCLLCQQPTCQTKQECKVSTWDSRFCSLKCQEEFWIRSNNGYLRAKVFEIEHGVCRLCNLNAQELFLCMRDAPKTHRKNLLDITWTSKLPLEQLNEMIRNPREGHFWQVDHIRPVSSGGGQCSLDNLQTLCTICHRERTARQAKERSQVRRDSLASKYGSDITRFLVKK